MGRKYVNIAKYTSRKLSSNLISVLMKKILHLFTLLIILVTSSSGMVKAEYIQRVIFNYSLDDFQLITNDSLIQVRSLLWVGWNEPGTPGVPRLIYSIDKPKDMEIIGLRTSTFDTIVVSHDKRLAKSWDLYVNDKGIINPVSMDLAPCDTINSVYPSNIVVFDNLGADVIPFQYNSMTKELIFTPHIVADVILQPKSKNSEYESNSPDIPDDDSYNIIKEIIFDGAFETTPNTIRIDENYDLIEDSNINNPVDYVIITTNYCVSYVR